MSSGKLALLLQFYKTQIEKSEKEIVGIVNQSIKHTDERRVLKFNLFDNLTLGRM